MNDKAEVPAPDEEYWGLSIWKHDKFEIISAPDSDIFTVMRGSTVETVVGSYADALEWISHG